MGGACSDVADSERGACVGARAAARTETGRATTYDPVAPIIFSLLLCRVELFSVLGVGPRPAAKGEGICD